MLEQQKRFIDFALGCGVLRFGDFTLKSGRKSPYFFNAGLFNSGSRLACLASYYAETLMASGVEFDMLYGAAYKGIPLVAATAVCLSLEHDRDVEWAFNRKEVKDHGEKGNLVGAPLAGGVVMIDDVVSAGTSIRESVQIITQASATPVAVLIALDRQERGNGRLSALDEAKNDMGVESISIINLDILMDYLESESPQSVDLANIRVYRQEYGSG
jgi:orotate phosphoribosyltransferase